MLEFESRQVRRARERREAAPPKFTVVRQAGNRATRRAQRQDDTKIIIRPMPRLNAVQSCKRTRRDSLIREQLRPARGMVHPRLISARRHFAIQMTALIFAWAAKRADERRAATAAAAVAA